MTDKITSLKSPITDACGEILQMFGLEHKFMCELSESSLNSAEDINIHLGLTQGLKGSIVIGLTLEAALYIISAMMGGMQVTELDDMGKSALGEFTNMLGGTTLGKLNSETLIDISPPTLAIGKKMFLMLSKAPSKKIFFKLNDTKFNIAYCIE